MPIATAARAGMARGRRSRRRVGGTFIGRRRVVGTSIGRRRVEEDWTSPPGSGDLLVWSPIARYSPGLGSTLEAPVTWGKAHNCLTVTVLCQEKG